jgi:hypothetical protein
MDLREIGGKLWNRFIWIGKGPVPGSCADGNGLSGSIKGKEFLD